ncbi:SUMO-activating enzyme subunit 2-like [Convolutriloba macropyga]|uniref:SUMO-activating enzyme subunit 2-like n=1 Tax=Convolutriloba macropyga TaxID=536237 RepID=UPI003F51D375
MIAQLKERRIAIENEAEKISACSVLLVGAGGVGCEVLKNLVLSGFTKIHMFDLDTIEVSNLNRQFLFQRQHVGQPKCVIAKESALKFNPNCDITTYHESIISDKYNVSFFKQFAIVINALDNRAARNHVNRLCLAADVALIESGTSGFFGQTYVIKKGQSECYECVAKPAKEKTYPTCTVRNTPSEPIHCIVWAKQLFNQLFGETAPDEDNEVSPDSNDQEAKENQDTSNTELMKDYGNENKISTRDWATSVDYDPLELITKLFVKDVQYLLTMKNLWLKRTPPKPLEFSDPGELWEKPQGLVDNEMWNMENWVKVLGSSINELKTKKKASDEGYLTWDKDDDLVMDFTAAAANIRCNIFSIVGKSRFDVKSMAGNIIPAIATTNAIVAGLMVTEAKKAIMGKFESCKQVFLKKQPSGRYGTLFVASKLHSPNPNCYVCSSKPEVVLRVNCSTFLIKSLLEKVLKKTLSMVEPDVELDDGKGTILVSSDPEDNEGNLERSLESFKVQDGTRLKADDFFQNFAVVIIVQHCEKVSEEDRSLADEQNFQVMGLDAIEAPSSSDGATTNGTTGNDNGQKMETDEQNGSVVDNGISKSEESKANGVETEAARNRPELVNLDDDDDNSDGKLNESHGGNSGLEPEAKKLKIDQTELVSPDADVQKIAANPQEDSDDDLVCLD